MDLLLDDLDFDNLDFDNLGKLADLAGFDDLGNLRLEYGSLNIEELEYELQNLRRLEEAARLERLEEAARVEAAATESPSPTRMPPPSSPRLRSPPRINRRTRMPPPSPPRRIRRKFINENGMTQREMQRKEAERAEAQRRRQSYPKRRSKSNGTSSFGRKRKKTKPFGEFRF